MYIADQAGNFAMLRLRGQNGEEIQTGIQILVTFLTAGKVFKGASVDHNLVVHNLFNLAGDNRDILELAENIGERHAEGE